MLTNDSGQIRRIKTVSEAWTAVPGAGLTLNVMNDDHVRLPRPEGILMDNAGHEEEWEEAVL